MVKTVAVAVVVAALAFAFPAWAAPAQDAALRNAISDLNLEGVRSALKNGANPNALDPRQQLTPLGLAAHANVLGVVDPSAAAKEAGFMDLATAQSNALEITKALFAAGAKLGVHDRMILAGPIAWGNFEQVRLLVDKGASVTADLGGYTPTEFAKKNNQEAIYKMLIARGGIPVTSAAAAQLALVEAASGDDLEGMERAIKQGATVTSVHAANKETALIAALLHGAVTARNALTILWLLEHRADPNEPNGYGDLPLHIFVRMSKPALGHPVAKEWAESTFGNLLRGGAKISGTDSAGRTPLHVAAQSDNVRAAEILLNEGAKVMPRDKMGKTPLDYAESAAMIKLLKTHGATER
jgi:ankyrin repeat protein